MVPIAGPIFTCVAEALKNAGRRRSQEHDAVRRTAGVCVRPETSLAIESRSLGFREATRGAGASASLYAVHLVSPCDGPCRSLPLRPVHLVCTWRTRPLIHFDRNAL